MAKKVVVGMSGGVDSSVAAYLLKEQGYEVIGVTMQIWQNEEQACSIEEKGCCGLSAVEDARRVAAVLDIPYYVMNFKNEFRRDVMDYFVREYRQGRTPNPCIACNRYVKWDALLARSREIGADYIATGHYARIARNDKGRYYIRNSVTAAKDQTYVLYSLTQDQLAHTLMPVGEYEKPMVRQIAQEANLPVAHKPDSEDICFIPDGDAGAFVDRELGEMAPGEGDYLNTAGEVIGRHKGITHYTIGQRKGLGIAAGHRIFVTKIDAAKNTVTLGESEEVFTDHLYGDHLCYMEQERFDETMEYTAKIRYSDPGTPCRVTYEKDEGGEEILRVDFLQKVRAVTPGQALVLYHGEAVAGGGVIR